MIKYLTLCLSASVAANFMVF